MNIGRQPAEYGAGFDFIDTFGPFHDNSVTRRKISWSDIRPEHADIIDTHLRPPISRKVLFLMP